VFEKPYLAGFIEFPSDDAFFFSWLGFRNKFGGDFILGLPLDEIV
jgi:hypothetical protein